ncbi:MAG: hypothetical protein ACYC2T_03230 [Bacillota bacterium]
MDNIVEIARCHRCGKAFRKEKLQVIVEMLSARALCKQCYGKYQRSQWGYW